MGLVAILPGGVGAGGAPTTCARVVLCATLRNLWNRS